MDGHQSFLLIRSDNEVGVLHAERLENVLAQIDIETLSADRLNCLAGEVDVDAVLPAIARIECERRRQGRVLAADNARKIGDFDVLGGVGIPEVVCEPGRMGQQLAQRDRPLGRAQFRLPLIVKSLKDLGCRQLGKHLADRPALSGSSG
jgi:hypothetical protein